MATRTEVSDRTSDVERRNQSLDTIRGLAMLLVLIGHFVSFAPYQILGRPSGDWVVDFGQGGVVLFFLLSGYLIWSTAQDRSWRTFLTRRLAKIFPAYWVNVIFVFVAGLLISPFPSFRPLDMVGNLLMLQGNFGIAALSGVYWTLIVEVKFYLLFVIVFYSPAKPLLWLIPIIAAAVNIVLGLIIGRSSIFLTYLPVFFVGAAIAARSRQQGEAWLVPLLATTAVISMFATAPHRASQSGIFLMVDIALFALILRSRWGQSQLAWFGLISYSVYLYHTTLGYPLLEAAGRLPGVAWPLVAFGVTALVLVVSWVSYTSVEQRFVRLGRSGGRGWFRGEQAE